MIALIMAGGSGTRFWPASRAASPKQFLRISGNKSMLRLTFDRLLPLMPAEKIFVVTAGTQAQLVAEHLPEMPVENIIIEPFGMNTAPCIALGAAFLASKYSPDEVMVVLPADHVIQDVPVFLESLRKAEAVAKKGELVTFGIVPEYPATGYGYIEAGNELEPGVFKVTHFKEKPDADTAEEFVNQGNFFWNSGMFCWSLETIRAAFQKHLPQAWTLAEDVAQRMRLDAPEDIISVLYARMPRTPVDIGIMEPSANRAVIPVSYGWSDVGSWKALADITPMDDDLNSFQKEGIAILSKDNFVYSNKFVALLGVTNLCVIETGDAILVASKSESEAVKNIVEYLKNQNKDKLL
jgi:mannose-1-phosphate guanylyltransferase